MNHDYRYLNIEYLYEYLDDNNASLKELINIFIPSIKKDWSLLVVAIENKDFDKIKAHAHKLKSSYRYMGVFSVGDTMEKIDKLAEGKDNINLIKILSIEALQIHEEIIEEVSDFLNNNP